MQGHCNISFLLASGGGRRGRKEKEREEGKGNGEEGEIIRKEGKRKRQKEHKYTRVSTNQRTEPIEWIYQFKADRQDSPLKRSPRVRELTDDASNSTSNKIQ